MDVVAGELLNRPAQFSGFFKTIGSPGPPWAAVCRPWTKPYSVLAVIDSSACDSHGGRMSRMHARKRRLNFLLLILTG